MENTSDGVFFSAAVGIKAYSLNKRELYHRYLLWNLQRFREHHFYRTLPGDCLWFPAIFWVYRLLYQQYVNAVTTSCLGLPGKTIHKQSSVFTVKKVGINQKKARSRVTFCDLTTQRIFTRSSHLEVAYEMIWNIWQNSQEKHLYRSLFLNAVVGCRPATINSEEQLFRE